ncbi:Pseudouridine-5'-phosphatase [Holothuria leucospilota]|uniref:pseudouridine 5'-phosphatase n=1 Tax=Holothuria leucospilota TaxID=206669 RepID=A0A9Q1BPW0_HOLLE|nr:Pseudouridine-5'-phosphatase [Holothuria leucospilota]
MGVNVRANISHIIFDMDGLLLNTETIYEEVYRSLVEKYGKPYPFELKVKCMGRKASEAAQVIIDDLDLPISVQEWLDVSQTAVRAKFPEAKLLPGVEKLVRHLHKHNIPIAVATGSSSTNYKVKTTHHKELFSLFHHILCSGDDPEVKRGKPNPDIFEIAARRFNGETPSPDKVLVFEDAFLGVEAAKAAKMHCIMIPEKRLDRKYTTSASLVLDSIEELNLEEWGLPPFD